jgi:CubicO group peptidase (beta-lactamase class C family)
MPDRSHLYGKASQPVSPDDVSYKYPSGGLVSTAEDLVKYGNALLDKNYLQPAQARLLFTSQTTRDGKLTHYGLGWQVATTKTGHRAYWHDGAVLGGGGFLLIYPDDKIIVAFLANAKQASTISPRLLGELFLACQ